MIPTLPPFGSDYSENSFGYAEQVRVTEVHENNDLSLWTNLKGRFSAWYENASKPKLSTEDQRRESLKEDLQRQVAECKEKNKKYEESFAKIQQFIQNDEELRSQFLDSLEQTKAILIPFTDGRNTEAVNNPLAEEWRIEHKKLAHFQKIEIIFRDFLEKNPLFASLLARKLDYMENSESSPAEEMANTNFSNMPSIIAHDHVIQVISSDDEDNQPETLSSAEIFTNPTDLFSNTEKVPAQEANSHLNGPAISTGRKTKQTKTLNSTAAIKVKKLFSSPSSETGVTVRVLDTFRQENGQNLYLFTLLKSFIEKETELTPHFKEWIHKNLDFENPHSELSSLQENCQNEVKLACKYEDIKTDFHQMLERNPALKEAFTRKMKELPSKQQLILEKIFQARAYSTIHVDHKGSSSAEKHI